MRARVRSRSRSRWSVHASAPVAAADIDRMTERAAPPRADRRAFVEHDRDPRLAGIVIRFAVNVARLTAPVQ